MISPVKRREIDHLISIYDQLAAQFELLDDRRMTLYSSSWKESRERYQEMLDGKISGMKASAIVTGLKQGLVEIPLIVGSLPPPKGTEALRMFGEIINSMHPQFFEKVSADLDGIRKRGRIKSEREYHLVRFAIEKHKLEKDEETATEFARIADQYEGV